MGSAPSKEVTTPTAAELFKDGFKTEDGQVLKPVSLADAAALADALAGLPNIWKAPVPQGEDGAVHLHSWSVKYTPKGCFFVGYDMGGGSGRVSTNIIEFDKVLMQGTTESGRLYKLEGPSGLNGDAAYVWNWAESNRGKHDPKLGDEFSVTDLVRILSEVPVETPAAE